MIKNNKNGDLRHPESSKLQSPRKRHTVNLILSVLVSGGILLYLFAKLDWQQVMNHLGSMNLLFIPALLFALIILGWIRAMRWKLLLPNKEKLSTLRLFEATQIGFFASFILPLRAGELIRPWYLSRFQPVTFSAAFASVLTERLADAACLLTLMLICLSQLSGIPGFIITGAKGLAVVTFGLILMVILSYLLPGKIESALHRGVQVIAGRRTPSLAEKINHMITEYFIGLRAIQSITDLLGVLFLSFALWTFMAGWYQIALWSFGEHPSLWVGMVLNVMVALAVAAPSAPGFIGTFQVGCIVALSTAYGYPKEFAMAYSVIAHLIQFLFVIIVGLIILNVRGLRLGNIRSVELPRGNP